MQYLIDGLVVRQLSNAELVSAIEGLVESIGMTQVGPVIVQPFDGYDLGASANVYIARPVREAAVPLAESHIIIHYWEEKIRIDIFSCKDFSTQDALAFCVKAFLIKKVTRSQLITRGFGEEIAGCSVESLAPPPDADDIYLTKEFSLRPGLPGRPLRPGERIEHRF